MYCLLGLQHLIIPSGLNHLKPWPSCKKLEVQQLRIILKQCGSSGVLWIAVFFFWDPSSSLQAFCCNLSSLRFNLRSLRDHFHICSSSEWQCDYCCRFNLHKTCSAQQVITVTVTWILTIAPALVTCDSQTCDWYSTHRPINRSEGEKLRAWWWWWWGYKQLQQSGGVLDLIVWLRCDRRFLEGYWRAGSRNQTHTHGSCTISLCCHRRSRISPWVHIALFHS